MGNWQAILLDELDNQFLWADISGVYVSGEIAWKSGIYRVEHADGACVSKAIMARGDCLPVCAECREPLLFSLTRAVPHLSEDEDFCNVISN